MQSLKPILLFLLLIVAVAATYSYGISNGYLSTDLNGNSKAITNLASLTVTTVNATTANATTVNSPTANINSLLVSNTVTAAHVNSPDGKFDTLFSTNASTLASVLSPIAKFNTILSSNAITAAEIDATTAKFNTLYVTNTSHFVGDVAMDGTLSVSNLTVYQTTIATNLTVTPEFWLTRDRTHHAQWSYANSTEHAVGMSALGTAGSVTRSQGSATEIGYGSYLSVATAGAACGGNTGQDFFSSANVVMFWMANPEIITSNRTFIGMSTQTVGNQTASTSPAADFLGFRHDTSAGDTKWMMVAKDGTTAITPVDSGVTVTTNVNQYFGIIGNNGGTSFKMFINGNLVGTLSGSNMPRTNQVMRGVAGCTTLENIAKAFRIYLFQMDKTTPF